MYMCIFLFQGDPVEFLSWLLNTLHYALCAGKRKLKSQVYQTFQGEMKIYTRKLPPPTEVNTFTYMYIAVFLIHKCTWTCTCTCTHVHVYTRTTCSCINVCKYTLYYYMYYYIVHVIHIHVIIIVYNHLLFTLE